MFQPAPTGHAVPDPALLRVQLEKFVGQELDALVAVAGAVPGVASVTPDAAAEQSLRVRLHPGADVATVALAVGRLLGMANEPAPGPVAGRTVTLPDLHGAARPQVVRLDVHRQSTSFTVEVRLACAQRTASGTASSSLTTGGIRRAVAAATLQAVEGLLPRPVRFELDHVERSDAGQEPIVVVHVMLVSPEGTQPLVGSAVLREDEDRAVARAAMDAVSRRAQALLAEQE